MSGKLPHDLLLDSEASLRLADNLLTELRDEASDAGEALALELHPPGRAADLPQILLRAHTEISQVLESLRRSRGILERTTMERVQMTQAKLREITFATENATIDMLDGLDQALGIVDRLDAAAAGGSNADPAQLRAELRDRLHGVIISMQFQDITAQQLSYASTVLEDLERRMAAVTALLDQNLAGLDDISQADSDMPVLRDNFDPAASTLGADGRQAVADEIFVRRGEG